MSYDVHLTIDTGGEARATVIDIGNYTSNVSGMWRRALPPEGIAGMHGRLCREVADDLRAAVERMERDRNDYLPMNPPNGWGDYEGALAYLDRLAKAAREHPACTIEVSR